MWWIKVAFKILQIKGVNLKKIVYIHVYKVNNVKIVDIFSNVVKFSVYIFVILLMYDHLYVAEINKPWKWEEVLIFCWTTSPPQKLICSRCTWHP
jgi:uncharacterized paraquat-inducible protein A